MNSKPPQFLRTLILFFKAEVGGKNQRRTKIVFGPFEALGQNRLWEGQEMKKKKLIGRYTKV